MIKYVAVAVLALSLAACESLNLGDILGKVNDGLDTATEKVEEVKTGTVKVNASITCRLVNDANDREKVSYMEVLNASPEQYARLEEYCKENSK